MTCGFKPAGSGAEQKYTGSLHGRAQDVAAGKLVLVWTVIGPADANWPPGRGRNFAPSQPLHQRATGN